MGTPDCVGRPTIQREFLTTSSTKTTRMYPDLWGTGGILGMISPYSDSLPEGRESMARLERSSATPGRAARRQEIASDIDVRDVLPVISAPTLVLHVRGDPYIRPGHGQYLAEHIPGATLLEIDGTDHMPAPDTVEALVDAIEEFLTGHKPRAVSRRALMSVAFTDIVDSTKRAAELGDKRWRQLLEAHESLATSEVESAEGRLVKFTGDGLMATFDGPARAVQCLQTLGERLHEFDLPIRAGVHTGEVELIGDDIGGIAVHIAARIAALAGAGEILTSSTVRDLVAGSGSGVRRSGGQGAQGSPRNLASARGPMTRTFVAIYPPAEAVEHLDEFLDVRREAGAFRWTDAGRSGI